MSTPNDGGPAFPQHGWTSNPEVLERMKNQGGMTLRDWFAGQASEEDILEFIPQTYGERKDFQQLKGFWPSRQWARYAHADKMLIAREIKARSK